MNVKPMDAETNLTELYDKIKNLNIKGVQFGQNAKQVPVAYGIKKLDF